MSNDKIKFVNLHGHSNASLYDGYGSPEKHMDYAYENGAEALALTDHGTMANLPHQVLYAKKMNAEGKKFKPLYGVEAYFHPSIEKWQEIRSASKKKIKDEDASIIIEDEKEGIINLSDNLRHRRHLLLLAQNQTGLNNLYKLISLSYQKPNFYYYPRVDFSMLSEYSEGIIATNACIGGIFGGDFFHLREDEEEMWKALRATTEKMIEIFGDRWYGELQWNAIPEQHELNKIAIKLSKEYGFELISTCDSHYPTPDDWKLREVYKRLGWLGKKKDIEPIPATIDEMDYALFPKNGEQIWESFKEYSDRVGATYDEKLILDSIERTHDIAFQQVEDFYPDDSIKLPDFVLSKEKTEDEQLSELAFEGLKEKGYASNPDYIKRLNRELDVISSMDFSKYFITMSAVNEIAREVMLVGAGRGSAAGSLVAYVLGITDVDPLKRDLLFERFLTRKSSGYPDIDYDCSYNLKLKEILIEKWGENSVVPITNWNTLQLRSVIKEISRMEEIPFEEVNEVTKKVFYEATPKAKEKHGIESGVYDPTYEECKEFSPTFEAFLEKYPNVDKYAEDMLGQKKAASRHAGGVVISDNLDYHMPLIASGGVIQTPWTEGQTVRHLEPMGFIKFDLLGLSTLRMLENSIRLILKNERGIKEPTFKQIKEFYDQNLHPDVIDFDDQDVYENVFHKGKWLGIFQFAKSGFQNFCLKIKPRSLNDLAVISAIQRPGPLGAGVDEDFLEAKTNPDSVEYLHPIHEEETKETYGFLIYEEQIMKLAHRLGNLPLEDANLLRKVIVKKGTGKEDLREDLRVRFMKGCQENSLSEEDAQEFWRLFELFSQYGFNLSHSLSYSMISFQCAWMAHYYPLYWCASYLNEVDKDKRMEAISVVKSFGFDIETPNINWSSKLWEVNKDSQTLFQPLTDINGVGEKFYASIKDHRPFSSIEDLMFKEDMKTPNKAVLDSLIRAQALNDLMDERFTGLKHFWTAVSVFKPKTKEDLDANILNPDFRKEEDFSVDEKVIYLSDLTKVFPLRRVVSLKLEKFLESEGVYPITEFGDSSKDKFWFIPVSCTTKKTKNKNPYYHLEIIDSSFKFNEFKCWGIKDDVVYLNKLYVVEREDIKYSPKWGYSTEWGCPPRKSFKLMM